MPGWYAKTEKLRKEGRIQMAGILQEQHPDRAQLFMQWKQMEFPLWVDRYNRYEVPYVPITVLLDEHGVVRGLGDEAFDAFLATDYEAEPGSGEGRPVETNLAPADLVSVFDKRAAADPDDGWARFRLGVAYRQLYDDDPRHVDAFQRAVNAWTEALRLDPNNYIWRRRIQQYGPRLDKPYPFYDWVGQARADIVARGENPVPLRVEPAGSELAAAAVFEAKSDSEPDPSGRVAEDEGFVTVALAAVPAVVAPGEASRIHVVLRPRPAAKAHWNNEAGPTEVYFSTPDGWQVARPKQTAGDLPRAATSTEARRAEFEVRPRPGTEGRVPLRGYALYYVCEDAGGTCLYRRQNLELQVTAAAK